MFPKPQFREYVAEDCHLRALELDPQIAGARNNLGVEGGGTVKGARYTELDSRGFIKQGFWQNGFSRDLTNVPAGCEKTLA